jgi:benzoate-CoA ligase
MDHITTPLPQRFNFARHVLATNAARAGKPTYIDDTTTLTYGQLEDRVRRFAAGLLAQGVRREERILLVMHDTVDLPVAFLGALLAGVVPVPLNTLLTVDDYAYMIGHSGAKLIVVSPALLACIDEALQQVPSQARPTVVIAGLPDATAAAALTVTALLAADPLPEAQYADTCADEFAFWLYSSGSTGRPKGAVHCHASLYWTAELYGKPVLGVREDDVVFSAAKLFFAYGLGNGLTFPLCAGATTILMAERPTPQAVFQRLVTHRPTVFCGVPTLYVAMLAMENAPAADQVRLRVCASAGEALPREVGERFQKRYGCEILDGLGSTEMLHIFISNQAGKARYGSSGLAVPGYELRLLDEDGQPVAPGEIGDLQARGPSMALLYWNNRAKSTSTFLGEWMRTGDKYSIDAEGYFIYAGRSDDMLKVSGQYVSPIEIESALMSHQAVSECAVVGKTDTDGLTKTAAYVVAASGYQAGEDLAQVLKTYVKGKLTPHKYPRDIVFVADLPKTATGKIQRFKLRAI